MRRYKEATFYNIDVLIVVGITFCQLFALLLRRVAVYVAPRYILE